MEEWFIQLIGIVFNERMQQDVGIRSFEDLMRLVRLMAIDEILNPIICKSSLIYGNLRMIVTFGLMIFVFILSFNPKLFINAFMSFINAVNVFKYQ